MTLQSTFEFGPREWARRQPDRVVLRFTDGRIVGFGELEAAANRYANLFRAKGLAFGDHAAVLLGNGPDIVALCWAASRSGVYLTPVPNTLAAVETAYIVNNSTARLVVADARYISVAREMPALCGAVSTWLSLGGLIDGFEEAEPQLAAMSASPRSDETPGALMMYSSGTTGAPKGIWRALPTQEQLDGGPPGFARDLISIFGLNHETRYLSTAPLYHAAPLRFVLGVTAAGGEATIMGKFDAALALDLVETCRITMSQWVPTMFQRLLALPEERRLAHHAPWHERAIHGAAPCTPALKRQMIKWWGPIIEEYYSGSEGIGLTAIDSHEWQSKPGSVGKARKGEIHVLADDDAELPPSQTGRVFFSGTPPFAYFGDPEKTAGRTSKQGWQTFGDIGHIDQDGYLFLSDRLDDMIISGGVNVYPQEIEAAIEEVEGVAECGVVGVPDEEFQERPVAYVVVRDPEVDGTDLLSRIAEHLERRLGRIKRPRDIRILAELPRSPTGKLLRRALRKV